MADLKDAVVFLLKQHTGVVTAGSTRAEEAQAHIDAIEGVAKAAVAVAEAVKEVEAAHESQPPALPKE